MILDEIVRVKRDEVEKRKTRISPEEFRSRAENSPPVRDFAGALREGDAVALIAEIKLASPSRGDIRADVDPVQVARMYDRGGASAISVLTDRQFFKGDLNNLKAARVGADVPLLRKDFIIDEYQVYESRALQADAILLIVRILDDAQLKDYRLLAESLGMAALVEIHDEQELERALKSEGTIIGINNRNLADFTLDLATTEALAPKIARASRGGTVTIVSESGIFNRADVERAANAGADAVLVGEALMRAADVSEMVRELASIPRVRRPEWGASVTIVKICGITNLADAQAAVEAGADLLGFIFYPPSPRYVMPEQARAILDGLGDKRAMIRTVGVFVNEPMDKVNSILDTAGLDLAQLHGKETPEMVREMGHRAFKSIQANDLDTAHTLMAHYRSAVNGNRPALIADAPPAQLPGGNGLLADWSVARAIASEFPILLAGGLNPGNVQEAIARVAPYGVDVSSGVERAPGFKDHDKVRLFVEQVKKIQGNQ